MVDGYYYVGATMVADQTTEDGVTIGGGA